MTSLTPNDIDNKLKSVEKISERTFDIIETALQHLDKAYLKLEWAEAENQKIVAILEPISKIKISDFLELNNATYHLREKARGQVESIKKVLNAYNLLKAVLELQDIANTAEDLQKEVFECREEYQNKVLNADDKEYETQFLNNAELQHEIEMGK